MNRIVGVLLLLGVASAFPNPEKYKPLIKACEGLDALTNCTASVKGVCSTSSNGERLCEHHHCDGPKNKLLKGIFKFVKHKIGLKHGHDDHHGWSHSPGDCGSKNDGDECAAPVQGQCIPTGKCPMFKGEIVCKPNNAHPPKIVTDACKGKQEGDACKMWFMPGQCKKIKFFDDMSCALKWPHVSKPIGQEAPTATNVVV